MWNQELIVKIKHQQKDVKQIRQEQLIVFGVIINAWRKNVRMLYQIEELMIPVNFFLKNVQLMKMEVVLILRHVQMVKYWKDVKSIVQERNVIGQLLIKNVKIRFV